MTQPASAYTQLAADAPFVLAKATDNLSLCQFFMGIMGRIVWECHKRGHDVFSAKIDDPIITGKQLRAKVHFEQGGSPDLGFMNGRLDGIMDFVGKKSEHMAKVMSRNATYAKFLQNAVEKLETHALQRGLMFNQIDIRHGFLSSDDYIVLELV